VSIKSAWNGTISFGMVAIPVILLKAIGDNDVKFHQHAPDGSRIRMKRVAESTGQEIASADIRKGYDRADGSVVFLTDDDFAEAFGPASKVAEILLFTSALAIPDIAKSTAYYVKPGKGGEKAYALLARALTETATVAVVRYGLRQRKQLGALSATANGYLILEQLEWADDIREPDFTPPEMALSDAEIDMAVKLVGALTRSFDLAAMHDDSQEKLDELITARIENGQVTTPAPPATAELITSPAELMEMLTASVAANVPVTPAKPRVTRKNGRSKAA
jgi:DNA end-binding protein Ku